MENRIEVKNLWHPSLKDNPYSPVTFIYTGPCLFSHRGVEVYKNPRGSWDYITGGAAITQRAGFAKERAANIIDDILDGTDKDGTYKPCNDAVKKHLEQLGFTPKGYDDF